MDITLQKADINDAEQIRQMQIVAFAPMLEKYRDFDISPATESVDRVRDRFRYPFITQYFVLKDKEKIGLIRIRELAEDIYKLVQIFILPGFQNKGHASQAITLLEKKFSKVKRWELDTIKQEIKLCCFYEKLGYVRTEQEKSIRDGMDLVCYKKTAGINV